MAPDLDLWWRVKMFEWGDREQFPDGLCPSCSRTEIGNSGRHSYGCQVREVLCRLEDIQEALVAVAHRALGEGLELGEKIAKQYEQAEQKAQYQIIPREIAKAIRLKRVTVCEALD